MRTRSRLLAATLPAVFLATPFLAGTATAGPGDVVLNPGLATFTANRGGVLDLVGRSVQIKSTSTPPECSDGINNDTDIQGGAPQDTLVDSADPECAGPDDDSEVAFGSQPRQYLTLTGTVGADGTINVPQSGISFPQLYVFARQGDVGVQVNVTPSATGPATGTADPATGIVNVHLDWQLDMYNGLFFDCVAPVSSDTSTDPASPANAGPLPVSPVPYSATDGTLTITGNNFAVGRAVPGPRLIGANPQRLTTQQECDDLVNANFGLPAAAGTSAVQLAVVSTPVFQSGRS